MGNNLARFSVTMPEELLADFDGLVARRGQTNNRSETIRDLVRDALTDERTIRSSVEVMGILSIFYGHHATDVQERLHDIQHRYFESVVSTTHVHVDHDCCLEVILLRGAARTVRAIADAIIGVKGVVNGRLNMMPVRENAGYVQEHTHSHEHGHTHEGMHAHTHERTHAHPHAHPHVHPHPHGFDLDEE